MLKGKISAFCLKFLEENQKAIVVLLLLITAIGGIVGFRYYKHTREDPEFCASCHLMQDAFQTWQQSKHRDLQCQICHALSILEENKLLISFVVKGTDSINQEHGRIKPWNSCRECHLSDVAQGSVTLSKSYGHAQHVFMQNIPCSKCHMGNLHTFDPNEEACKQCHSDKMIHGMGMEGLSCLKCHSYRDRVPKMVTNERCLSCHKNIPLTGIMAGLKCFDCHHPHGEIKPQAQECLKSCHGNESRVGQHQLHMQKADLNCLDCHKAHVWSVGKREAKNLCDRCHKLKDPATFIY
jgi:nitrate/TMAO reductase-like tetraheme cytochrome c subunit